MVRASGSSTSAAASISARGAPRRTLWSRTCRRAQATSRSRRRSCVPPQLLCRNGTYAAPGFVIGRLIAPLRSQVAVIKLVQLGGKPAAEVNAVGNVPDGNLVHRDLRPEGLPHLPADLAMQLADAVGARCQSQSQDRHAEFAGPAQTAKIAKFAQGEAQPARCLRKVAVDQLGREVIVPGVHRSVEGKDQTRRRQLARLGETKLILVHQTCDVFQRQKGRMPFVHVINGGMKPQRLQGAISADAEHDLLPDAHLPIAAIKLVGDMAIVRMRVERNVGIQQVERNPPDVHPPYLRINRASGEVNFYHYRLAARTDRNLYRKVVEVVINMRFLLPSRLAEVLAEISLLVKQPDTHQRNVKIAGGLEMVTGQYA